MAKKKENNCFSTFAWLIYKEVEIYVNEHTEEYEKWLRARAADNQSKETKELKD